MQLSLKFAELSVFQRLNNSLVRPANDLLFLCIHVEILRALSRYQLLWKASVYVKSRAARRHGSAPGPVRPRLPAERRLVPGEDRSSAEAAEEAGGAGLPERPAQRAAARRRRWVALLPKVKRRT